VNAFLQFEQVSFTYGLRPILTDVSFALPSNGLMALVGPNGAGKSTLLRLAAGLLSASGGTIQIAGRGVDTWQRRELARTVALVPQHLDIPFPFTLEQIVAQGRTPHRGWLGGVSQSDLAAVERALQLTGITHLRGRTMNEISGGEQQRVKLGIALAQEPGLLLLDEPLQHLDIGRQAEFLHLLLDLHGRGLTIVAAMHDLAAVRAHFPLTLLLTDAAGHMFGPTAEVLEEQRVHAAFHLGHRSQGDPQLHPQTTERSHRQTRPLRKRNSR
jgi:iron complex transport system ATP-binding protein